MGDHKSNVRAQVAGAGARQLGAQLQVAFTPKPNVVILPPERIRAAANQTEVYGVAPVLGEDGVWRPGDGPECWHVAPPDAHVVPEGATLGIERLDLVVNLVAQAVGGMLTPDGRVMARQRHLQELFREDAQHFLATLGGGAVPS